MVRKMCKITGHDHLWEFNKCTKKDTGFAQSARPLTAREVNFDSILQKRINYCVGLKTYATLQSLNQKDYNA